MLHILSISSVDNIGSDEISSVTDTWKSRRDSFSSWACPKLNRDSTSIVVSRLSLLSISLLLFLATGPLLLLPGVECIEASLSEESEHDSESEDSDELDPEEDCADDFRSFLLSGRFRAELSVFAWISGTALLGDELAVVGLDRGSCALGDSELTFGAPDLKKVSKVACFFSMKTVDDPK